MMSAVQRSELGAAWAAWALGFLLVAAGCRRQPGLAGSIFALHTVRRSDGPDRLWFFTPDRLGYLEDGRLTVVADPSPLRGLSGPVPGSLLVDEAGGVYFGTSKVLYFFDPARRGLTILGERQGLVSEGASKLLLDREANIWVGAERGLSRLGSRRFLNVDASQGLAEDEVTALVDLRWLTVADDGRLYVATNRGLLDFDGIGTWRLARGPTPEASNVYGVHMGPSGQVWVATNAGLHELHGKDLVPMARGGLRLERPTYFILEDGRGHSWFGTDDGVFVWDGSELRHLTVRHGLAGRETNRGAALLDHLGRVWIGTDQGVSIYQPPYDRPRARPPIVELRSLEVNGVVFPADETLRLSPRQNHLTFQGRLLSLAREAVEMRYQLEGWDDWSEPVPFSSSAIRYSNLPPGSYRFRLAVAWAEGSEEEEVSSGRIVIAPPLTSADVERMNEDFGHIEDAVEKMGRHLKELLELSQIGHVTPTPRDISLNELAREAVAAVGCSIGDRDVVVEIEPRLPIVTGDRLRSQGRQEGVS